MLGLGKESLAGLLSMSPLLVSITNNTAIVLATVQAISAATPRFLVEREEESSSNSTFVHNIGSGSLAFAAVTAKDAGDFFFHFEAPAEYSWVAIGTGDKMDGSLMWIAYRSGNGTGTIAAHVDVDLAGMVCRY